MMSASKCQGSKSVTACLGFVDFAASFIMSNTSQTLSVSAGGLSLIGPLFGLMHLLSTAPDSVFCTACAPARDASLASLIKYSSFLFLHTCTLRSRALLSGLVMLTAVDVRCYRLIQDHCMNCIRVG